MNSSILNLHFYPSPITKNESRILKETKSLIDLGIVDRVIIFGLSSSDIPEEEELDAQRLIKRIISVRRQEQGFLDINFKDKLVFAFYYLKFCFSIIWYTLAYKPQFLTIRRVELLPFGVFAKILRGGKTRLIYAPHELESERVGLNSKVRKIFYLIEKTFIRFADNVEVVCDPIAEWYRERYKLNNVYVLRNVPTNPLYEQKETKNTILKDRLAIPYNHLLVIYQGVLSEVRGVNTLIDVFKQLPTDKHIVFMGYGEAEAEINEASKQHSNIHFYPAVPLDSIIYYTSSADIGIFYILGTPPLSYRYSLPNKFFEYLISGIPVILSDNLEYMSTIVLKNNWGYSIAANPKALLDYFKNIQVSNFNPLIKGISLIQNTIGWQFEQNILLEIYA
jgi:glycosyltransferase involved in cell wall biosynthesis